MPFCPNCGISVSPNANFCQKCAAPLSQSAQNLTVQDGVIAGDVHQTTNITNISNNTTQVKEEASTIKVKGPMNMMWSRNQYFGFFQPLGWFLSLICFTIVMLDGEDGDPLNWIVPIYLIWLVGHGILMKSRFSKAELG